MLDPFNLCRQFQDEIRKTTDLLAAGQVALYPIAAEGLAPDTAFKPMAGDWREAAVSSPCGIRVKQMQTGAADRDSNHSAMEELAKDTGGQAFYNTNGLNDALTRVVNNGTRYYSLAYSPSNPTMDGKYRRIQVKLLKGKDTLAYRRGYYADDLANRPLCRTKARLRSPAACSWDATCPTTLKFFTRSWCCPPTRSPRPTRPASAATRISKDRSPATAWISRSRRRDLKLDPTPDGARHGNIEIVLLAYNREGKPLNFVVTKGDVNLRPKLYESRAEGRPADPQRNRRAPSEYVYLRTGIYDLKSNTAGTLGIPLTDASSPSAK